jgi:hypothetical protein
LGGTLGDEGRGWQIHGGHHAACRDVAQAAGSNWCVKKFEGAVVQERRATKKAAEAAFPG